MFGAAQQRIQHDRPLEHDPRGDGTCPNRRGREHFRGLRGLRGAGPGSHAAQRPSRGAGQPERSGKGERARELIEGRGCELLYLPSYSPDLNPIEEAFAKIKGLLRKSEARTREALVEAIGAAISAVTAKDARGFFEHCGYHAVVQLF
jgi:DDE superfamily endonuclease